MKFFIIKLAIKLGEILQVLKIYKWINKDSNIKLQIFFNNLDPRFTVMIGLTYFCQCNCPHCGMALYKKDKKSELTTNSWLEAIGGLSLKKARRVLFFGGEPLLRKDILRLIAGAKKKRLETVLDTNGYLLTAKMVKNLKKAGLDIIHVSIDSANPETHNALRGRENIFEKATEGIKNCLKEKISSCILSTYATKENIKNGDLEKIISLGEKLKVGAIRILSPIASGKWLNKEEIRLNGEEKKQIKNFIKKTSAFLEEENCVSINKKLVYISPYGEVQPCCYIPLIFGNIKEEPLEKILEKMWRHPMFKIKTRECLMNSEEFRKKYLEKPEPS